jgi:hypothetical protein
MTKRQNYRMASKRDDMQRGPGLTPIDNPGPQHGSIFDPDSETGKLGVQQEDDDSTPATGRQTTARRTNGSTNSPTKKPPTAKDRDLRGKTNRRS